MRTIILVFDSYDCTGKTTLVNHVVERGFTVFSDATVRPNPNPEFHRTWALGRLQMLLSCYELFGSGDIALDRYAMTEYAYSPVKRGYSFEDAYFRLEDKMLASKAMWFWVMPHINDELELRRRYIASGEDFVTIDELLQIRLNYLELFTRSSLQRILVNGMDDPDRNLDLILQKAQASRLAIWGP